MAKKRDPRPQGSRYIYGEKWKYSGRTGSGPFNPPYSEQRGWTDYYVEPDVRKTVLTDKEKYVWKNRRSQA